MMADSISITGIGIICAIGNNAAEVLDSLLNKRSGIGEMKYLDSSHREIPVGEVRMTTGRMKSMLGIDTQVVSRTSVMGAIAVKEALGQAGIADLESKRVVLVSGTTVGVMDVTEKYFERMKTEPDPEYLPQSNECGKSTDEIAEYAGLGKAGRCTVSTACSSALNAIILGAEMLLRGDADVVIAGGSESLSKFHLNGFNSLMILDKDRCRPFDASRAGLNLGEGAAYVVLQKNAGKPLAYINGYANRCDAYHQTATSENGEGAYLSMMDALSMAGLQTSDIQYVNAHGTGTFDNDRAESAAFRRVFGSRMPAISSTKSYTGHTTSASGSIETVICVLAMLNRFIPASLGWSEAMPDGILPSPGRNDVCLENVMCNSFGFGGNDSSLILGLRPVPVSSDVSSGPSCKIASRCIVSSVDELKSLNDFMSPMESRRMCKLMKASLLSAFKSLKQAGIDCPDAIITATSRGMLETSNLFLTDIVCGGETLLKPTLFMQSTHNTVSSAIAIRTKCHGYNTTYSHGDDSKEWALYDAALLIKNRKAGSVLVCSFDEHVEDCRTVDFKAESIIFISDDTYE